MTDEARPGQLTGAMLNSAMSDMWRWDGPTPYDDTLQRLRPRMGVMSTPAFGTQCALDCYAFSAASCTAGGGCPRARMQAHAAMIADRLSGLLPDGYRFEYEAGPLIETSIDEAPVSDAEHDELARRWREAMERTPRHKRLVLLTPLPRRVRLKLAARRALTAVGERLGDHVSWRVTGWLWRATGLLGRRRQA